MIYQEIDSKNIQNIDYEKTIVSDGNIAGTCELGKAEIQLLNDSNEYSSLKGNWIKTIFGSMYVYDVAPIQEKINIKLSCYDIKKILDIPYEQEKFENLFPTTISNWRNAIAIEYGVIFGDNNEFPLADFELPYHPYIGEKTSVRNVLQIIAQACVSAIDNDSNDIFYFVWFNENIAEVKDWIELTTEKEYSTAINTVVLGRGDVDDAICYPDPKPESAKEFKIDNNYILDPQDSTAEVDRRAEVIETIYNRVNGFKNIKFTLKSSEIDKKLSLKLGQKISYKDIWGNILTPYITKLQYSYLGGNIENDDNYTVTLSSEELKEASTEYKYNTSISEKIRKLGVTVNQESQRIDAIAQTTDENSSNLAQLTITQDSIEQQVSSASQNIENINAEIDKNKEELTSMIEENKSLIELTAESITNAVQKSGGNNKIRNSVGFKGIEYWAISDDANFYSSQDTETEQTTTSGSKFILSGGTARTDFSTIIGTLYTVSLKMAKTSIGTAEEVFIELHRTEEDYDVIYSGSADLEKWKELTYSYVATINAPYLLFKSGGDTLEFSDLIVSEGEVQTWSQHSDEVYGKTQQLDSSGLHLSSLTTGETSKLDNNDLIFKNGDTTTAELSESRVLSNSGEFKNQIKIGSFIMSAIDEDNLIVY